MKRLTFKIGIYLSLLIASVMLTSSNFTFAQESEECSCVPMEGPYTSAKELGEFMTKCSLNFEEVKSKFGSFDAFWYANDDPEDLYLRILYKTRVEPQKKTLQRAASDLGYSEDELEQILNGNISIVMARHKSMTQGEAWQRIENIKAQVEKEKKFQDLEAQTNVGIEPIELYANGRTDDSGFDLIVDLSLIEYLLTGGEIDIPAWGSGTGQGQDEVDDSQDFDNASAENNKYLFETIINTADDGLDYVKDKIEDRDEDKKTEDKDEEKEKKEEANDQDNTSEEEETDDSQDNTKKDDEKSFDPAECLVENQNIQELLDEMTQKQEKEEIENEEKSNQSADNTKDSEKDEEKSEEEKKEENSYNNEEKDGDNNAEEESEEEEKDQSKETTKDSEEEVDDFCNQCGIDDPICVSVCFSVEFINKRKPKASADENCIHCHIEGIIKEFKTLISHDLSPGKVTGNLFEDPSCKKTSITDYLNFNVYIVENPIATIVNEDRVGEYKIENGLDKILGIVQDESAQLLTMGAEATLEAGGALGRSIWAGFDQDGKEAENPQDEKYREIASEAPTGVPLRSINENVAKYMNYNKNRVEEQLKILEMANKAGMQADFAQGIEVQMKLMLSYFSSLKNIFGGIVNGACLDLESLEACK